MRRLFHIKPPSGWSGFVTELVIVVLGVFIALAAQEAVNAWNARSDLAEFRSAVDREVADNLASYRQRIDQSECAAARLEQLEAWQSDWRDGSGPEMTGRIRRPIGYTTAQDVWSSGVAANLREMPLEQRLNYAALYAGFQNYENIRLREAEIWQKLYAYDHAKTLSPIEVNALRGLILSARALHWSLNGNWEGLERQARAMGLKPSAYTLDPTARRICVPITFAGPVQPTAALQP
jgi:hypothetical protein